MMIDKLLEPNSLRSTPSGFSVGLRLCWYRSLPISTVEVDSLVVDGVSVFPEQLTFCVGGKRWPIAALREQTDQLWDVIETATLEAEGLTLAPGYHNVEAAVSLFPPYIRDLRKAVRWSREMELN